MRTQECGGTEEQINVATTEGYGNPTAAVPLARGRPASYVRAMKRSRAVRLTLAASASSATLAALPGCSGRQQDAMHCVERGTDRVVPDSLCGPPTTASRDVDRRTVTGGYPGGYGGYAPYLWYYGGSMDRGFMRSGAYAPLRGSFYRSSGGYSSGRSGAGAGVGDAAFTGHETAPHGGVFRSGFGATGATHGAGG